MKDELSDLGRIHRGVDGEERQAAKGYA